jgi:hypothetical protein
MPSVADRGHTRINGSVDLWALDEGANEELKRSVQYLNTQLLRTTSEESAANKEVIHELSKLSEPSQGIEKIEYINRDDYSVKEFQDQFLANGRPCMIRGLCHDWKASTRWKSPADMKRWHGDMPVRITEFKIHPSANPGPLRIPLKNYLEYAEQDSGGADFPWYGFDDDFEQERANLLQDWEVPIFFREDCYDVSPEARHVFPKNRFFIVGGSRSGTGLHVDPNSTCAWNSLLCGRKRWCAVCLCVCMSCT